MTVSPKIEHFDVLIVGAGLSGIGAGAHFTRELPGKSYAILEGREAMGGTWDLFRYPGVRSDSDMYTLGYRFRPWEDRKAIAEGPAILKYIRDTSAEYNLDEKIRYGHRVRHAAWNSDEARWTVDVEIGAEKLPARFTCGFLFLCTGYYDYDAGYTPDWPGVERFNGPIIHPQKWPADLDYAGKRVVVIGSGATAVTLVPAMAETAAHVTMLQRSPTYIITMPAEDGIANWLNSVLPARAAYMISRWKNIIRQMFFYGLSRSRPATMKGLIAKGIRSELGDDFPAEHFAPDYDPWDQRLCIVPDGDLFKALRSGTASVVTDRISTFTESGVDLESGASIDADIIVTATGLVVKIMAGLDLTVDGEAIDLAKTLTYKGMMYSGVPNLASAFGYTNASWTLKCDLTAEYVVRLIRHMDRHGFKRCMANLKGPMESEPVLDFNSGYVLRALPTLPRQGVRKPWRLNQNYIKDLGMLRYGSITDDAMEFK